MLNMPPQPAPPGAATADGPGLPAMPPPSAGMQLAEMAGMLDQKVSDIQEALSMVTSILQQVLGEGAVTADGPLGPEAEGMPPEDEAAMLEELAMMEGDDGMGMPPMQDSEVGFDPMQLAMQRTQ